MDIVNIDLLNTFFSPFLALLFFLAYTWIAKVDGVDTYLAAHINTLQVEKLDRDGEIPWTGTSQWDKGADINSAATLIPGADGNYFDVLGVVAITKITPAQSQPGTCIKLHFDSALIIEHDGDFIVIPGSANINVRAGDEVEFMENTVGKFRLTNWYSTSKPNLTNLLPNAGLGLWSWSTLAQKLTGAQSAFELGAAIYNEDAEGVDDSGNWTKTDCTMVKTNDPGGGAGGSDNYYTITETGATQRITQVLSGLTVGKLYKFSVYIKNGTGTWATAYLRILDSTLVTTLASTLLTTEAAWEDFSVIFEATEANNQMVLDIALGGGLTAKWDDMRVIEVAPGCVDADDKAPDWWTKTSTLDLIRIQADTAHSSGFYAARATKGANSAEYLYGFGRIYDKQYHYEKFRGVNVIFGCWIYSVSAADNVKLQITDSDGTTESSFVAADVLTWVEISRACGAAITEFKPQILLDGDITDVAYISEPMLVIGPEIGEGNYNSTKDEIIFTEDDVRSHEFENTFWSDATGTVKVRQDSNGRIPIDTKGLFMFIKARDPGSAGVTNCFMVLRGPSTPGLFHFVCSIAGLVNNAFHHNFGLTPCDEDGNMFYQVDASGGSTFDLAGFHYRGVLLGG